MKASITSAQNPQFKQWSRDLSFPERTECPWIGVEGARQIEELSRRRPLKLLLGTSASLQEHRALAEKAQRQVALSEGLIKRLSRVVTPQHLVAFFPKPQWDWSDLTGTVLYLDGLSDPGNLGTLFRTAAATGTFSLVTAPGTVSCFNDKVVRSSSAYLFQVPFLEKVPLGLMVERGYRLWAARAGEGAALFEVEFQTPLAVILGSESQGVQQSARGVSSLHIPMRGGVESLNAGVSGALIMYELLRRQSKP